MSWDTVFFAGLLLVLLVLWLAVLPRLGVPT